MLGVKLRLHKYVCTPLHELRVSKPAKGKSARSRMREHDPVLFASGGPLLDFTSSSLRSLIKQNILLL